MKYNCTGLTVAYHGRIDCELFAVWWILSVSLVVVRHATPESCLTVKAGAGTSSGVADGKSP